ncbi:MAG: inorganic phosphate transporter [Succinivibrionaceae bacterium]|nr:inorganic phosphate transporter [Succinivibrionaceae bacterium]
MTIIVFLMILAAVDLFVGVSNDAVNFLNSAVGSRVAPLNHILFVAAAGVLIGATFSSGMMEIARSGMFYPEKFSFEQIVFIYFAVMVSDVIMLNIFNSLGLPTSTTVSIIFELLGAAVFTACWMLWSQGAGIGEMVSYIKPDRTFTIVSGILISVVVAFVAGAIIQFVLRILFSFQLKNTYRMFGALYSGLSLTGIIYFLVMKGAKGASFMKPEYIDFINANTAEILAACFVIFTVISEVLILLGRNVFKLIILGGTFALAFAFAGNDLVNFVGVPLAALDGYNAWTASGTPADSFMMTSLAGKAATPTIFLVLSGLIMVLTLWFSRSARKVIQTSINLSSSAGGTREQFGATMPGRLITRMGLSTARFCDRLIPAAAKDFLAQRYKPVPRVKGEVPPAFDYVRASVNLVVAAILISSATSLKLPLSTTYVTFMVAMGSSFADGAWDRESAVYRISGVITVISGWFLTAACAFIITCCTMLCIFIGKWVAVVLLLVLAIYLIWRSNFSKKTSASPVADMVSELHGNNDQILSAVAKRIPVTFNDCCDALSRGFDGFFADEETTIRRARNKAYRITDYLMNERNGYYSMAIDEKSEASVDTTHYFYVAFNGMYEASKEVQAAISHAMEHVANRHVVFGGDLKKSLLFIFEELKNQQKLLDKFSKKPDSGSADKIVKKAQQINTCIDKAQISLVEMIAKNHLPNHSAETFLTFLNAMRDMSERYAAIVLHGNAIAVTLNQTEKSSK